LDLIFRSAFVVGPVLYLIHRSGESWAFFGIVRPSFWDLLLGFWCFVIAIGLWWIESILIPADWWGSEYFPKPRLAVDYLLMIVKHAANGISEELVTRAYLISRLQQVLGSTTAAVVISAVFFASYHLYQGLSGLVFVMMFGLAYGLLFVMIRRLWPLAFGHMAYNVYIELA
jgi:membrane protease YdiL (CAAX protease family)